MSYHRLFQAIGLLGILAFCRPEAQGKSDCITPVYQWADKGVLPYFFIEKPVFASLGKPTMFLRVGDASDGQCRYVPADSLKALLAPNGEAAAAYNRCGKSKSLLGYGFYLAALTFCVIGNWQKPVDNAIPFYAGAGACLGAGFICLKIPRLSKSDHLRIISIHNRSLGNSPDCRQSF
jgi:hypothetical protein